MRFLTVALRLYSLTWSFGIFLLFMWLFLTAYLSPAKATLFAVNIFGEANVEIAAFLLLVTPVVMAGFSANAGDLLVRAEEL
jgi:hypothetical protein